MTAPIDFDQYLHRWGLVQDGAPIITHSSHLLPVRRGHEPAMLRVATEPEEREGAALMRWWSGTGAARVMEHHNDVMLLERATGTRSLSEMAEHGADDEASRIICRSVSELHKPHTAPLPYLVPLTERFQSLHAASPGGVLVRCADAARKLLAEPRDVCPLHGDIHHANILDFGQRGWLAIDPKGLLGERGFDYANLFCNPSHPVATSPGRLARRADVVARAAGMDRLRLLHWILAWAGLSAVWGMEDGNDPHVETTLRIAETAAAEIDRS